MLDATVDPEVVCEWWARFPDAAVAMRTGRISDRIVLDVDGRDGEESLRELGPLPDTAEVLTPRGKHLHYRYPPDVSLIRCAVALRGLAGLDLRGDGGYALVPRSIGYCWELSESAIAIAPASLIEIAQGASTTAVTSAATDEVIHRGTRNAVLASLGGTMRRKGMSELAIRVALITDNQLRCDPPLEEQEVIAIAKSVSRYAPAERVAYRARPIPQ